MRVTVCQWPDRPDAFETEWGRLIGHVRESSSEIVLLPDMPFSDWFADSPHVDASVWAAAVHAHDAWEHRLPALASAIVVGTRPVDFGNERYDEGFVWDVEDGVRSAHAKSRLDGPREKAWINAAAPEFVPMELQGVRIGFLIGPELWLEDEARRYGQEGIDVLVTPRSSRVVAFGEWLDHARAAAALARAYSLSSNRAGEFGGQGWIIAPDGELLGLTTDARPLVSVELPISRRGVTAGARAPVGA
jgi:N-carbamoylputrescine amidase